MVPRRYPVTRRFYAEVAVGALLALAAAFYAGRFSAPVKTVETVKVETKTVTVTEWKDRIVEKRVAGPVRVRTITIEKPGGERVVERVVERGPVTTDTTTDHAGQSSGTTASNAATVRLSETGRPGWRAAVSAAWSPGRLSLEPARYTAEVDRRLFGTIWLGLRASTDKTAGVAVGLEW